MTEKNGEVNGVDRNDSEPGNSSSSAAPPQSHNSNVGATTNSVVGSGGGEEETSAMSSIVEQESTTISTSTVEVSHHPVRQSTTMAGQKPDILASTHVSRQVSDLQSQS